MSLVYTPDFYEAKQEGARRSAYLIAPVILGLVRPQSIVDVGCGTGTWLSVFSELGVGNLMGVDGAHVHQSALEIEKDCFVVHDLSLPFQIDRRFDLVMSLEVAEHLPAESADAFVDTLVALGPVVLFSAAVPHQGGDHHVNENWPHYWARRFRERDFIAVDYLRDRFWNEPNVEPWYAQNLLIYVRESEVSRYPGLSDMAERTDWTRLARVHPRLNRKGLGQDGMAAPLERSYQIDLEITEPIRDIDCPRDVESLTAFLRVEGDPLGKIQLPAVDGRVLTYVIEDAVAGSYAWELLGLFFTLSVYQRTAGNHADGPLPAAAAVHDDIGWVSFLQQMWGRPGWPEAKFHDTETEDALDTTRIEIAGNELRYETSHEPPHVRCEGRWLLVTVTTGGVTLGRVDIRTRKGLVSAQALRTAVIRRFGMELCRAAVREAVVGRSLRDDVPLRERLRRTAASLATRQEQRPGLDLAPSLERAIAGQAVVLLGSREGAISTSQWRRAVLPGLAAPDLTAAARAAGEPVHATEGGDPCAVVYAPEWTERAGKWHRILRGGLRPAAKALQRISARRRAERIEARARRERISNVVSLACAGKAPTSSVFTHALSILCYHRVTPERHEATDTYRTSPESFDEQLRYFHEAGYHSVRLDDWRRAILHRHPLPGRAFAITFEGGYDDFLVHAWPRLLAYGFTATLFLAAELVGHRHVWDDLFGERVSLLSWRELRRLGRAGCDFGSLGCTNRPLTALSLEQVSHEAAHSRTLLQRGLRQRIEAIAYPHGHLNDVVAHLIGGCGYVYGLTCRPARSGLGDRLLELPRIEVFGADTLAELLARAEQ